MFAGMHHGTTYVDNRIVSVHDEINTVLLMQVNGKLFVGIIRGVAETMVRYVSATANHNTHNDSTITKRPART